MAQKSSSFGGRIFFIIVLSIFQDIIPGGSEIAGFLWSLFPLVIIWFVFRGITKKNGGWIEHMKKGFNTLALEGQKAAIKSTQEFIEKHPGRADIPELKRKVEEYKEMQQKTKRALEQQHFEQEVAQHTTSGEPEALQTNEYTYAQLSQNYNVAQDIKKDDLDKQYVNPYSLDGK